MTTVVIVPGSFCPPALYDNLVAEIKSRGQDAVVVSLPSVGHTRKPPPNLSDDAAAIVAVAEPLIDAGRRVVIICHSYGGIPTTQSMEKLSKKARESTGKAGGVETVIYLTSVIIAVGTSNYALWEDVINSISVDDNGAMKFTPEQIAASTFSSLPPEEGVEWGKKISTHSLASFKENLTYNGYADVNIHYIICEQDHVIPPETQRNMVEALKSNSDRVKTYSIDSDHAPIVHKSKEVVDVIEEVLKSD